MRKINFLLSASALVVLFSCGSGNAGKPEVQSEASKAKEDSIGEQRKLDSLFNNASQNVSAGKDSSEKK